MKYPYFKETESAAYVYGTDPHNVIPLIAARFMGDNPEMPFIWRSFDETGIAANEGGQYIFNFSARYPDAPEGSYAYAVADLYCPAAKGSNFTVGCESPVKIYLNGECVFTSGGPMEGNPRQRVPFHTELNAGFNRFVVRCEATSIGFGCLLANAMPQWEPCNYVLPFASRKGEAGWAYTAPTACGELGECEAVWGDDEAACDVLGTKIPKLRVFTDENDKMNLSLADINGEILVVSNFTLCADCRRGNRPDFFGAAKPDAAIPLYERFVGLMRTALGSERVQTGTFGADMKIALVNDGPITLVIDHEQLTAPKNAAKKA